MKKALVMLTSLVMLFALAVPGFAADAATDTTVANSPTDVTVTEKPTVTAEEQEVTVEEVKVTVGDTELSDEEVEVATVTTEALAEEQPVVAAAIEENKAAVAEVVAAIVAEDATPEQKEAAVSTYFEAKGEEVVAAISAAIEASKEVSSLAEIEPVVVTPIKVNIVGEAKAAVEAAFAEGKTFTLEIAVPEVFSAYQLSEDSFICAELVKEDGTVVIVTFKLVNGKLVGEFPALGVISNFWVGSSVTAPQTGNTHLEGYVVCGIVLCAAVLLYSVKRFKTA